MAEILREIKSEIQNQKKKNNAKYSNLFMDAVQKNTP